MNFIESFKKCANDYADKVRIDFENAIINWDFDVDKANLLNVSGGLLSRQCMLGTEFVREPLFWNQIDSPLLLRSMLEVTINLGWISLDPKARSDLFVDFGLGQSKLGLEQARNLESLSLEEKRNVDQQELWLNCHRHEIFGDVNVGLWSGISLEKMAQESNLRSCFDMYSALVGAAHGTWEHLTDFYNTPDASEFQAKIPDILLMPNSIESAAEQVNITFSIFRRIAGQNEDLQTYLDFIDCLSCLRSRL
ncbi:hypothetical protein KA183_08515 [bacterium]|nr:hypothetical protein [bacterium]